MTVAFGYNSADGTFQFDAEADVFHIGCGCCAPGCTCTSASLCAAFSDCTPCSLRITFTGYTAESCQAFALDPGIYVYRDNSTPTSDIFWYLGNPAVSTPILGDDTGMTFSFTIDPPTNACLVHNPFAPCEFTAVGGQVQIYFDGCTTKPHAYFFSDDVGSAGNTDLGEIGPCDLPIDASILYTPPDLSHPAGQTVITVSYGATTFCGVDTGAVNDGTEYGFIGTLIVDHALTAADFPITVENTDGTGGGSATLTIECCSSCSACPSGDLTTTGSPLAACASHWSITIAGLTTDFTHGWDVYTHYDSVPVADATLIDGWQSADAEAQIYCSGGKWFVRVTDKCNELGFGATAYIEWQADISECPSSRAANWTLIHNDFGGTPVLALFPATAGATQCPSNCQECCGTYNATLASTGCTALNTTFALARADFSCQWVDGGGSGSQIFCDGPNNQWVAEFFGTVGDCGVAGVIEFVAPMYDDPGGDQKRCPLTDGTKWTCVRNDFGSTTGPTISIATEDCGCATVSTECPTDCSSCLDPVALTVSGGTIIDGSYFATRSGCTWSYSDPSVSITLSCTSGIWTADINSPVAGPCEIIATAAVSGGCPTGLTWTVSSASEGCGVGSGSITVTVE